MDDSESVRASGQDPVEHHPKHRRDDVPIDAAPSHPAEDAEGRARLAG